MSTALVLRFVTPQNLTIPPHKTLCFRKIPQLDKIDTMKSSSFIVFVFLSLIGAASGFVGTLRVLQWVFHSSKEQEHEGCLPAAAAGNDSPRIFAWATLKFPGHPDEGPLRIRATSEDYEVSLKQMFEERKNLPYSQIKLTGPHGESVASDGIGAPESSEMKTLHSPLRSS